MIDPSISKEKADLEHSGICRTLYEGKKGIKWQYIYIYIYIIRLFHISLIFKLYCIIHSILWLSYITQQTNNETESNWSITWSRAQMHAHGTHNPILLDNNVSMKLDERVI